MAGNSTNHKNGPATRRGFIRDALRNALGAGASVSGGGTAAAIAIGGKLADSADAAANPYADAGPIDLVKGPGGVLIDREMLLAERTTMIAVRQIDPQAQFWVS